MEHEKPLFARVKDTLSDIQYGRIKHPWAVLIDWGVISLIAVTFNWSKIIINKTQSAVIAAI